MGDVALADGILYGSCCQVVAFEAVEELWGGGKKTHSVLDADVLHLMCISSPNFTNWW